MTKEKDMKFKSFSIPDLEKEDLKFKDGELKLITPYYSTYFKERQAAYIHNCVLCDTKVPLQKPTEETAVQKLETTQGKIVRWMMPKNMEKKISSLAEDTMKASLKNYASDDSKSTEKIIEETEKMVKVFANSKEVGSAEVSFKSKNTRTNLNNDEYPHILGADYGFIEFSVRLEINSHKEKTPSVDYKIIKNRNVEPSHSYKVDLDAAFASDKIVELELYSNLLISTGKKNSIGMHCKKCNMLNKYVEAGNQTDGSYVCYECR